MNELMILKPYKYQGTWVFDDPARGLEKEPFIKGITEMIDVLVANIPNAGHKFRLYFACIPFVGAIKLDWDGEEDGGNWYYSEQFDMCGWLCPALYKYFTDAPEELYVRAEQIKED
jgi:hypothetical protein